MNSSFLGRATVFLAGLMFVFGSAYVPNFMKTAIPAPMQAGPIADEVAMPDFGPRGNGAAFGCSSNVGIPAIRLANGGVTVYFDKANGRLLQITNASGEPFTFGGLGCDNTGLFQDWEPKNSNWVGCSKPPGRVNPPNDYCSFTAYLLGGLTPAVSPNPTYEITSQGEPHVHVSNVSQFERPSPAVWGNPDYDPQPAGKWIFNIDYYVKSTGVINVQFSVSNTNVSECFSPWVSFPFVLVSPFERSDAYVFETGPQGARRINHGDFFSSLGVKDTYIFHDPRITGLNGNVQDNRYSPLLHKSIDVPASSMCPAGRYKESHGPYSTLTGLYPGEFNTIGPYLGVHKSDMSRGVIVQVPSNTTQIVLYQPGEPDGIAEAFVTTELPIGRTDLGEHYTGSIYFTPWGGINGIDLATAKLRLNAYTSSITSPSSGSCACATDFSGTSDPPQKFAFEVKSSATASISSLGSGSTPNTGYTVVEPAGTAAPYGTAVFTVRQNGVIVSEGGVPATVPTKSARVFAEIGGAASNVNTGIAFVNPNMSAAELTLTLRNTEGQAITSGTITLAPGEHISRFIPELSLIAPSFVVPSDFTQTGGNGALDVSSSVPISVMAIRLTLNQRNETLLTTTPAADLTQPPTSSSVSFPQFADGGGYKNTIILLNNGVQVQSGQLVFWNDDGSAATIEMEGNGPARHSFTYAIPARGARIFRSTGQGANVRVGWAEAVPDPFRTAPAGAGIFQLANNGVVVSETGVPSSPSLRQLAAIVDLSGGHNIGVALSNAGNVLLPLHLTVTKNDGSEFASANLTLPPRGHISRFVTEMFSGMPAGFVGELHATVTDPAASGVSALTLRSLINERGEFLMTTFPVVDPTQIAPSPVIFPQIADGGGYATQLILMNLGQTNISSVVRLFSDQGRSFSIQP